MEISKFGWEDYSKADLELDQRVANLTWKLLLEWLGELSLTHLWYRMPPHSFLQLVPDGETDEAAILATLKREWQSLVAIEETARTDKAVAAFVEGVMVGKRTYCRECFLRLAEEDFNKVPEELASDLVKQAESHGSTLLVENLFNRLRREEKRAVGGAALSNGHKFHITATAALHESFGRPGPSRIENEVVTTSESLKASAYTGHGLASTLNEDQIRDISMPKPTWSTTNPQGLKRVGAKWQAVVESEGQWEKMSSSCFNLLLEPGVLIMNVDTKKPFLVLSPTAFGCFAWRVAIDVDTRAIDMSNQLSATTWLVIRDPKKWKCAELIPKAPLPSDELTGPVVKSKRMSLVCGTENGPLLNFQAYRGFRQLNVPLLRALANALGLQGHKRGSEAAIVESLCIAILGDKCTPEVLSRSISARNARNDSPVHVDAAVLAQDADSVLQNEWLDHEECKHAWRELLEDQAKQKERRKREETAATQKAAQEEKPTKRAKSRAEGSSSVASVTAGGRTFNPLPVTGMEPSDAQLLAPANTKIRRDTTENRYTVVSALIPNKSHTASKSYGEKSGRSQNSALRELLQEVWRFEYRHSGIECPHDLSKLLPD
eukprot:6491236-Amphidinium_carterae.1